MARSFNDRIPIFELIVLISLEPGLQDLKKLPPLVRKIEWSHNGTGQFSNHQLEIPKKCFWHRRLFPFQPPAHEVIFREVAIRAAVAVSRKPELPGGADEPARGPGEDGDEEQRGNLFQVRRDILPYQEGKKMAKPIELGLVLEGEDARRFHEYMERPTYTDDARRLIRFAAREAQNRRL